MQRRKFLSTGLATGAAAGAGVTGLITAAPAIAQDTRDVTVVSTWPRDFPGVGVSAQRLCDRITELSEGRLKVTYFAAGERVGAFDSFDEVASGNADAYLGADYYWTGKHPAFAYFTAVPFGMTTNERSAWIKYGGGQELWDEVSGEFGLKALPAGQTGVQMGGWFNKEVKTAADFKGLKMRIPGLGGDVLSKLGASTVSLPGGQIYENLVSGSIDATEWIGPYNDYFMKLYEAAKYYYYPGMHEPSAMLCFGMNKEFWEGLSNWEKAIVTAACMEENSNALDEANANNGAYLQRMIDENGVQLREFSDDIYQSFGEAAKEVFEETRDHSDLATRVDDAFQAKLREIGTWMSISDIAYSNKRNKVLGIKI